METNTRTQMHQPRQLRAVWLRCHRCFSELTQHGRTASGGYRCNKCGQERDLRAGRHGN